jgi:hypothetical protein
MDNGARRVLWVVVVILGVVSVLHIFPPRLRGHRLDKRVLARLHLRVAYAGLVEYTDKYGSMPTSLGRLREEGLLLPGDLMDPERAEQEGGYSYVTNVRFDDPMNWLLVFDDRPDRRDGCRHVLFVDGRVERHPEKMFQELLDRMAAEMQAAGRPPPLIAGD